MSSLQTVRQSLLDLRLISADDWSSAEQHCAEDSASAVLRVLGQMPHPELPGQPLLSAYQREVFQAAIASGRFFDLERRLRRQDYVLLEKLDGGNTSWIFRAWCPRRKLQVVIKEPMRSGDRDAAIRLQREAAVLQMLDDPRIIRYVSHGECQLTGSLFLVLEYADGRTLRDYLDKKKRLGLRLAGALLVQLLKALLHAHGRGIIHRDVKPENMILVKSGENSYQLKLLDFGLGKVLNGSVDLPESVEFDKLTKTNIALGTFRYMAPEQCENTATVTAAADLYSVGVMAFEMLTGDAPFVGDSVPAVMLGHVQKKPPLVSDRNPAASAFDQVVDQMLRKLPSERGDIRDLARRIHVAATSGDQRVFPRPADPGRPQAVPLDEAAGVLLASSHRSAATASPQKESPPAEPAADEQFSGTAAELAQLLDHQQSAAGWNVAVAVKDSAAVVPSDSGEEGLKTVISPRLQRRAILAQQRKLRSFDSIRRWVTIVVGLIVLLLTLRLIWVLGISRMLRPEEVSQEASPPPNGQMSVNELSASEQKSQEHSPAER